MDLFLKDFLLNVLIISSPFVLFPYLYKLKNRLFYYRLLLYFVFALSMIVTMCFPVKVSGFNYDFRSIPLTIGSLYGGSVVALLLYGTLITVRFFLGGPENVVYTLSILPTFLLVYIAIRKFQHASLAWKIAWAVILSILIKFITLVLFLTFTNQLQLLFNKPLHTLTTYAMQAFISGITVYTMEFLNRHYHMQEEVVKSEKMRLVSDMAASVAHEIRNPLTAVRGFIHLLGSPGIQPEKKEFYKNICFSELDRAEHIIADYLSLARTDPELLEAIDVNVEVEYLSNILLTYANFNNVHLSVQLSKGEAPVTMGDRYKFRQALINIGKNAIEAMPNGGTLELVTECRNDTATVIIRDTGSGMSADQLKRLGTPYYSTKEKGTGLGTMISFSIIKKMHGKIDVRSEVGKGTRFMLDFPQHKVVSVI
ncbi:ATP-binding protein [Paenibacillus paeoniae]|nr:ATP-binding protein [Paenibacillus paeoniae]